MKNKFFIVLVFLSLGFLAGGQNANADWEVVGVKGFGDGSVDYTSLAFNPETHEPYIAYKDYGHDGQASVMRYNGSSWVYVGSPGISTHEADDTSLAFHPLTFEPYLAYRSEVDSDKATVMKFNGTSWNQVGSRGFSAGEVWSTNIVFNPLTNEPYVAYQDVANSNKATVMKFNGTSWVTVGLAGINDGLGAFGIDIAIDPSTSEPYIVFHNGTIMWPDGTVTVMKFNGTSWVTVGSPEVSNGIASSTCIAFNPLTNEPYVAYEDFATQHGRATVKKFNGSAWVTVGIEEFTAGDANSIDLAFNPLTHESYIVYEEDRNTDKATAMKFNGSSWAYVGAAAGFSDGLANDLSLAFHPTSGEPYVAFRDEINGQKATVMKYVADNTSPVAPSGLAVI